MFPLECLESGRGIFLPQFRSDERRFQFHSNASVHLCGCGCDLCLATRLCVGIEVLRTVPVGVAVRLSGIWCLKKLLAPPSLGLTAGVDRPVILEVQPGSDSPGTVTFSSPHELIPSPSDSKDVLRVLGICFQFLA
jgi:hypothetical protein